MNARTVIFSIIFGLVMLALGIGLGVLYQGGKGSVSTPQVQVQTTPDSIKVLSSGLVASITARGSVAKINGSSLTLMYRTDSRIITMTSDAKIYALVSAPITATNKSKYAEKQIAFKDVKVGDNVNVNVRVLANGTLEGFSLVVLPGAVAATTTK